jgi:hypothetical protein
MQVTDGSFSSVQAMEANDIIGSLFVTVPTKWIGALELKMKSVPAGTLPCEGTPIASYLDKTDNTTVGTDSRVIFIRTDASELST